MASQKGIELELKKRGYVLHFWHFSGGWKTAECASFREFSKVCHSDEISHLHCSYQKDGIVVRMGLEEAGFPPTICIGSAPFPKHWTEEKDGMRWHYTLHPEQIRKAMEEYSDKEIVDAIDAGITLPLTKV